MLLLASILAIGLMLGIGFGGSFRHFADARLRLWWLLPVGLILQVVPVPRVSGRIGDLLPFGVVLASFALIAVVCAVNWRMRGFPAILLGVLLNAVPIAINEGMPVSGPAIVEAGGSLDDIPREGGEKHHLMTEEDQLTFLADVISIREPFTAVVSVGDLMMWLGAGWFVTAATLGRAQREPRYPPEPETPQPSTTWGTLR